MEISLAETLEASSDINAILVPFFEDQGLVKPACNIGDLGKDIEFILELGDFKASFEEIVSTYLFHRPQKRLILFGLGKEQDFTLEVFRRSLARAVQQGFKLNSKSIQLFLPELSKEESKGVCESGIETLFLMNYVFRGYKQSFEAKFLEKAILITSKLENKDVVEDLRFLVDGVNLTRELVNTNADIANPEYLKKVAESLEKEFKSVKLQILGKKELKEEDMGLFLSVARGSNKEPYVAILEYKGAKDSKVNPVLIGKGITYDTGGLSLKPTSGMIDMKSDMGGSAVVLGVMKAVASMKLPINLTCVCAFAENAIGSNSYKIGDVYTGRGKVSVEVTNTDAEGRLALADSISYSIDKLNPTHIIDVATLTGACEVALGSERSAFFSNDSQLADHIASSGEKTAERVWQMPLDQEYKDILKSKIADLKNSGVRAGSLIASAMFLKEFVKKDVNWAHIDIAGTTYLSSPRRYHRSQATGYGVRLLVQTLKQLHDIAC